MHSFPPIPAEFEGLTIPSVRSTASAESSSTGSSSAVDSGVDSELSPSSPDSACYNNNNNTHSSAAAPRPGAPEEEPSIIETAETLLSLSGKKTSQASAAVVLPQHPVPKGEFTHFALRPFTFFSLARAREFNGRFERLVNVFPFPIASPSSTSFLFAHFPRPEREREESFPRPTTSFLSEPLAGWLASAASEGERAVVRRKWQIVPG